MNEACQIRVNVNTRISSYSGGLTAIDPSLTYQDIRLEEHVANDGNLYFRSLR